MKRSKALEDMMVKAIALFDLDMTLLNDDKQIAPENVAALHALRANDVLPMLSTGRNLWELRDLFRIGGLNSAIGANGADIMYDGVHLMQQPIGQPQIRRIVKMADEHNVAMAFFNDQHVAVTRRNAATERNFLGFVKQPHPPVVPDFYEHEPVCMMLLFVPRTPAGDAIGAEFKAAFPELAFYRNAEDTMDLVNTGITKASGLAYLMRRPELQGVPTYAFGDGNNDIEILQAATVGIAMGNALPQVAAVADYQTGDYLHGGIPDALAHFHLI